MEQENKLFLQAERTFGALVAQIQDDQWENATPDDDWDVRDLVKHNLEGLLWVPDMLHGRTIEEVGDKYVKTLESEDLKSGWTEASEKAIEVVSGFNEMEKSVHLSYGDFPARTYLQHQLIDFTIHAWDLARAIGADERLDGHLVQSVYELFEPQAGEWRASGILGPAIRVDEEADVQTKLLALSGRDPE